MPSTTTRLALPKPLDADPMSDMAKWVRDLADALDNLAATNERRGAVTATTDASGDLTVTHGLSSTPTAVLATVLNNTGSNWTVHAHTIGATTFKLRFRIANTAAVVASTAGVAASWLAIV